MKLTTTKDLNEKVFAYILNCIDSEAYGIEAETGKEKLQFLANTFNAEYVFPDNLKRYGSYLNVFKEWIQGLPSSFSIDFYNMDILRLAKEWRSIPQDATESEEDKILENWYSFIANKTFQLMKRYKVLPY